MTLSEFWSSVYLPWAMKVLKPSSLAAKVPAVQKFILPHLGHLSIDDITEQTVEDWHRTLLSLRKSDGTPYASTYLRTTHNQLTAMLEKAVEKGIIIVNPAISLGSIGDHDARKVLFWTAEEYALFIAKVEDRTMRLMFNLAFWCSLRRKEILMLSPEDVGDDGHWMTISTPRPVNPGWTGTPVVLSSPFETRRVDVPIFMREDIRDAREKAILRKTTLFPYDKHTLSTMLSAATDNVKLRRIGFDGLRDSSILLMIKAGFTASDIARHTGTSLQALERRFSAFFRKDAGFSERLVDYVLGAGLDNRKKTVSSEREDDGPCSRKLSRPKARKKRRQEKAASMQCRITPSNRKDGLHAIYSLDQMPVRIFATWCGLNENARKRIASSGLTMLQLIKADDGMLRDFCRIPSSAIRRLREAFKALGIGEDVSKSTLHAMGRYTFEDFASFRDEKEQEPSI